MLSSVVVLLVVTVGVSVVPEAVGGIVVAVSGNKEERERDSNRDSNPKMNGAAGHRLRNPPFTFTCKVLLKETQEETRKRQKTIKNKEVKTTKQLQRDSKGPQRETK